jgi:hypothetical protein
MLTNGFSLYGLALFLYEDSEGAQSSRVEEGDGGLAGGGVGGGVVDLALEGD